jgi:hypothetical protein
MHSQQESKPRARFANGEQMPWELEPAVRLAVCIAVVEARALALHGAQQLHALAPPRRRAPRVLAHAVQARAVAGTVPRPPPARRRRPATVSAPHRPGTPATAASSSATSSTASSASTSTASTDTYTVIAPAPAPAVAPRSATAAPAASTPTATSHAFLLLDDDTAAIVGTVPGIRRYSAGLHMNPRSFCDGEHRQQQNRRAEHGGAGHRRRMALPEQMHPRRNGRFDRFCS